MNFVEAVRLLVDEYEKGVRIFISRTDWEERGINTCIYYDGYELVDINKASYYYDDSDYKAFPDAILATDWYEVKKESIDRFYNFYEAIEALKKGKAIKRKEWTKGIKRNNNTSFNLTDIEAKDWIIEE